MTQPHAVDERTWLCRLEVLEAEVRDLKRRVAAARHEIDFVGRTSAYRAYFEGTSQASPVC